MPWPQRKLFGEASRGTELYSVWLNCSKVERAVAFTGTGENVGGAERVDVSRKFT